MKQFQNIWMPDEENELHSQMELTPIQFAGAGTYQFRKFAAAFPYIRNFENAIDVGGHVGIWSRVLARCFGHVDAFEPMKKHQECFRLNLERDADHVTLHPHAVNNVGGELEFIFNTCFTHVVVPKERDGKREIEKVKAVRLDDVGLDPPDFIKIDVEGFEYEVILGAEKLIRGARPTMIVEQKTNGFAERYGRKQTAASDLLQKWGATLVANYGGDHILAWAKKIKKYAAA